MNQIAKRCKCGSNDNANTKDRNCPLKHNNYR